MEAEPRRKPTLRFTFASVLFAGVLITAITIIALSYFSSKANTLTVADGMMQQVAHLAHERITRYLEPVAQTVEMTHDHFEAGILDVDDLADNEEYFFSVLEAFPTVSMMNFGNEADEFIMVRRAEDGSLLTKLVTVNGSMRTDERFHREPGAGCRDVARVEYMADDGYRATQRPWYTGAAESGQLFWSDAYVFWSDQRPGITASIPITASEQTMGVLAFDVDIIEFSHFLASLDLGEGGRIMILDADGRIVASPNVDDLVAQREGPDGVEYVLQHASDTSLPEVVALTETQQFRDVARVEPEETATEDRTSMLRVEVDGQVFLGVARSVHLAPNRDWTILVSVPEDTLLAAVKANNNRNILTSIGLLLVALVVTLLVSRSLSRSLYQLEAESKLISSFDFNARPAIDTRFREVHQVYDAFEGLRTALRGLVKYLPLKLVQVLLSERIEPELGSKKQSVTILFSDVANFTTISEEMDPTEMSKRLGEYFAALTACVEGEQGTVIQYVGDTIMAVWGAPHPVRDPAKRACAAALKMQRSVESLWKNDDFPAFSTRIGIHTAEVAVGHFGSPDRLYYGAVGDGVNQAARLEGANKTYGTEICVSEAVRADLGNDFSVRRLDVVALKGKQKPSTLFEVMGRNNDVEPTRAELAVRYEAALDFYLDRRFDEAVRTLYELLAQDADDEAARLLLIRSEEYRKSPPGDDWDGVYAMTTK